MIHDHEAERAVIGACLLSQEAAEGAVALLAPDDFTMEHHQWAFTRIRKMVDGSKPVDEVTLLEGSGDKRQRISAFLLDVKAACVSSARWKTYAESVKRAAQGRGIVDATTEAMASAQTGSEPDEVIAQAITALESCMTTGMKSSTARDLIHRVAESYRHKQPDPIREMEFGLTLRKGDSVVIGAWPAVGKSAMLAQFARQFADRHLRGVIYSLEMSDTQWATRYISAATGVTLDELEAGVGDKAQSLAEMTCFGDWPDFLDVVDDPSMNLRRLVADVRRRARKGLKFVGIDYLQLLVKQDFEAVTDASRILKMLAREVQVPVISLSQLRRPQAASAERPTMHHLKQSGAMEADADIILLLSDYKDGEEEAKTTMRARGYHVDDPAHIGKRLSLVDCAKHRQSPPWRAPSYFDGTGMTWQRIDQEEGYRD